MRTSINPRYRILLFFCVHLTLYIHHLRLVLTDFIAPKLPAKRFAKLADINLGAMFSISTYNVETQQCSDVLHMLTDIHQIQTLEYAVNKVNEKSLLGKNINLGFVALDACDDVSQSNVQTLTFVPQTRCQGAKQMTVNYDVVGVIGATPSSQAIGTMNILSPAQIPYVSYMATSDVLSNKKAFPYFLRTTTPDKFQFNAIYTLIQKFGWTYVSIVHATGHYGEQGYGELKKLFDKNKICVAVKIPLSPYANNEELDLTARKLTGKKTARTVILLAGTKLAYQVILATKAYQNGSLVWLGIGTWSNYIETMDGLGKLLWGALLVSPVVKSVTDYDNYFRRLTPGKTENPWFKEFWEKHFSCTLVPNTCNPNFSLANHTHYKYAGRVIDTVNIFADAIARLLKECKISPATRTTARSCVTGPQLLQKLMKTNYTGLTGRIKVNANGDYLGRYQIVQVKPATGSNGEVLKGYIEVPVAEFDAVTETMTMVNNISWEYHSLAAERSVPDSVCSMPCKEREAIVVQEDMCCWLCLPCRPNERLISNRTLCAPCPIFTWPDAVSRFTECRNIPVAVTGSRSISGIALIILAVCLLVCCLAVLIFFIYYNNTRVIKASSRVVAFLMLLAISLGYITIVMLQFYPNEIICRVNFIFFCLSFTLLYGSLLTRSLSIYRIFKFGRRTVIKPRCVTSTDQLLVSIGIGFTQALICIIVTVAVPDWHKRTMRDVFEPYVEITCDMNTAGLTVFLFCNLLMVIVCASMAYKTRFLPDNFNESAYITMCVSTTLLLWLSFIPSYIMAPREHFKILILALALALNDTVALVFLFFPRIYAIVSMEELGVNMYDLRRRLYSLRRSSRMEVAFNAMEAIQEASPPLPRSSTDVDQEEVIVSTIPSAILGLDETLSETVPADFSATEVMQDASLTFVPSSSVEPAPEEIKISTIPSIIVSNVEPLEYAVNGASPYISNLYLQTPSQALTEDVP